MGRVGHVGGWLAGAGLVFLSLAAASASDVHFTDTTQAVKVDFKDESSATSNKYLVETMGGGVALFDYDNDGRLDIFFVNGAKIDDPCPNIRRRTNPIANSGIAFITRIPMVPSPT